MRYKQIMIISCIILFTRFLNFIGILVADIMNQRDFECLVWVILAILLALHLLLILANLKFKNHISYMHAPILVLLYIPNCYVTYLQPMGYESLIFNVMMYAFFLICGLLLNASWILTTISTIINLVCALLIMVYCYDINDIGSISQYIFITAFVVFSLYH